MLVVESFSAVRVLCIGDAMLDHFVDGKVERISPESPIPVFATTYSQSFPGGAANVARNIAGLGACCTLISVIGEDPSGEELANLLIATERVKTRLIRCPARPTINKTRFVASGQHVLRVDIESSSCLPRATETAILTAVKNEMPHHDIVVLSDYAKGVLSAATIAATIAAAAEANVPVIVDPKSKDFRRYAGATLITPNVTELEAATGIETDNDETALLAAEKVIDIAQCQAILVTRAAKGVLLVSRDAAPISIAAAAREVYDVVGAGDTVVATVAVAIGSGHDFETAARTANVAAGIVVARRGTSTVSQSELLEELSRVGECSSGIRVLKILERRELQNRVMTWKNDGLTVGFTNGCFDIIHLGHIRLLRYAKGHCDRLIVALNSDRSTKILKGPERPINSDVDRAEVLASLDVVDGVIVFDDETPQLLIEELCPDILVKGSDYTLQDIVGGAFVQAYGGTVLRFDLVPGKSSTAFIRNGALIKDSFV